MKNMTVICDSESVSLLNSRSVKVQPLKSGAHTQHVRLQGVILMHAHTLDPANPCEMFVMIILLKFKCDKVHQKWSFHFYVLYHTYVCLFAGNHSRV